MTDNLMIGLISIVLVALVWAAHTLIAYRSVIKRGPRCENCPLYVQATATSAGGCRVSKTVVVTARDKMAVVK